MNTPPPVFEYNEVRDYALLEQAIVKRGMNAPTAVMLTASILAVALALFHLYAAGFGTPESHSFRSTHLSVMLVLALLVKPLFRASIRDPLTGKDARETLLRRAGFAADLLLVGLVVLVEVYILWDVEGLQAREGDLAPSDVWIGLILIGLVLEATRRSVGWTMVFITGFFIVHTLYTDYFFGFLYGPPVRLERLVDVQFVRTEGIFGIPLLVVSTYILLFILFGAILIRSGAGRFFIDLAVSLTGHRVGGPAKAAVVASAFLGTVSGSATANVVTTGSFTIPMMQRLGYRGRFAAAVEACASSGGQITPPIMGAAAFIIAEFMGVPYLTVVVAAILPALLYFITIYFMVHLEADKSGIKTVPRDALPRFGAVMKRGWHLLLSLVVLVGLLVYGFTPMLAAFWAILVLAGLSFISAATRMSATDLLAALETGVRSTIPVTVACACAGIIIGCVFVSGLGLKFTNEVIGLADGNLLVLLILTGLAAIFLGMGITTTAVYITVAALIVPALIKIGVAPMAAHMFAFYYGVVSTITPPVALASFAAAAIAGSPPMATAVESARIGIAKYLVPFIFVYNPALLFEGPVWLTAYSGAVAVIGLWGLSVALEGWYHGAVQSVMRLAVGAASIALMVPPLAASNWFGVPGYALDIAGGAVLLVFAVPRIRARRDSVGQGAAG
ncbi:MAG: TRAP transporter fused permease subunit [Alphaproteobacteria bacterium]|nr:TRAP transporter fused permease subunit [Alphaproteobacteria bacterium]